MANVPTVACTNCGKPFTTDDLRGTSCKHCGTLLAHIARAQQQVAVVNMMNANAMNNNPFAAHAPYSPYGQQPMNPYAPMNPMGMNPYAAMQQANMQVGMQVGESIRRTTNTMMIMIVVVTAIMLLVGGGIAMAVLLMN